MAGRKTSSTANHKNPSDKNLQPILELYELGELVQALTMTNQQLQQYPESATLYNILGSLNAGLGQHEPAIESYKKALNIEPNFATAYSNMGNVLNDQGNVDEAIVCYSQAIKINPNHRDAYYNLGVALRGKVFTEPKPGLDEILVALLDYKTFVMPREISGTIISLLRFDPLIKRVLEWHSAGTLKKNCYEAISSLSEVTLLLELMSVCPVPDLEFESVLAQIRSFLLLSLSNIPDTSKILKFQAALALHCFTNEYIFHQTEEETKALIALEKAVEKKLDLGRQPSSASILCLASYNPLHGHHWCDMLTLPLELKEVGERQILEPKREKLLRSHIPTLQKITDDVSSKVKAQYETNPYPRWVYSWQPTRPASISRIVKLLNIKLFDAKIAEVTKPNILVAGCGTGQHSIGVASRFQNSKVLAVDLSFSSLAYAKRKTDELGIKNIDYMQADILDLEMLAQQFDVVESCGVLHHMEDPMAGWKVLRSCLKPGGLMKIALYSKLARQEIIKLREDIIQLNIDSSDFAMKSFREHIVNSAGKQYKNIHTFEDFYCLSEFRDLLFHVQEHQFTVSQIRDCLSDLGLKFCGFESPHLQNFGNIYEGGEDIYDLTKWESYENQNPEAFQGMYQFWCQKI